MTTPLTDPVPPGTRAARVSRRINRLIGPSPLRRRGFGVLEHTGRRSGREYHNPLRRRGRPDSTEGYIAFTHRVGTDCYQNLVSGPGAFRTARARHEVANPRLVSTAETPIARLL